DQIAGILADPTEIGSARSLATDLTKTALHRGRILVTPCDGLEIVVRQMLAKVLPDVRVEYSRPDTKPEPHDFVLQPGTGGPATPEPTSGPTEPAYRSWTTTLFKALQVIDSRKCQKVFSEYVVFDTETTDLDVGACEVVELAAARVRDG